MSIILDAFGIHKIFKHVRTSLHVVKGIDLRVHKGEVISIVGPSGAGKSTLLHILGGLDNPSDGKVIIKDEDVYALNEVKRARLRNERIGFVFQFYHLLQEFTALENVILPLCIHDGRMKKKEFEEKGIKLLKDVGLGDRILHKPNELSGGEQQRVAIARALINKPEIIFCDEPTGNLDSETEIEIINLLLKLNKENEQTLVIVTHDENIAEKSHKVIKMRDGKIV